MGAGGAAPPGSQTLPLSSFSPRSGCHSSTNPPPWRRKARCRAAFLLQARQGGGDEIDRVENGFQRAEREIEVRLAPGEAGLADPRFIERAKSLQQLRLRALETVDRLLFVAHREQRRHAIAHALAREEVRAQPFDDMPLLGAGILRLVDQNVVDPRVKFIEHPFRRFLPRQKAQRLRDEVFEIERGAGALGRLVAHEDRFREAQERDAGFNQLHAANFLIERDERVLRIAQALMQRREPLLQCGGHQCFARLAGLGAERSFQRRANRLAALCPQRRLEAGRTIAVALQATGERANGVAKGLRIEQRACTRDKASQRIAARKPERSGAVSPRLRRAAPLLPSRSAD